VEKMKERDLVVKVFEKTAPVIRLSPTHATASEEVMPPSHKLESIGLTTSTLQTFHNGWKRKHGLKPSRDLSWYSYV